MVLNVVSYSWGRYHSYVNQQQMLHVSTNMLLSYVRAHPSGRFVPWDVWALGNIRAVPRREVACETTTGMHPLCGMRAPSNHITFHKVVGPIPVILCEKSRVVVKKVEQKVHEK